jgi:23S rRNA (uracil1939-C5)-methyltransferase
MNVDGGRASFFNPNKMIECPVLESSLQHMVRWIRDLSTECETTLAPYSHLEVRAQDSSGRPGLLLTPTVTDSRVGSERRELISLTNGKATPPGLVLAVLPHEVRGQHYRITENALVEIPLQSFLQINRSVNKALVAHLVQGALSRGSERFLDLFCGSGNLSLPLLAEGLSGSCVDRDAVAVEALMRSAERLGVDERRLDANLGDVTSLMTSAQDERRRFDLVVVDPPRTGAGGAPIMSLVAKHAARHVAMISCEPETLTRDLVGLVEHGFAVEQITAFDMFPQTHHIEVVVWLRRTPH